VISTKVTTPSPQLVPCDQAVFTSVRSRTGEGYRIVAASNGVRAEEKVEITRRSPSHDSLCASSPGPIALTSYAMNKARHCVSYCCHAGREHTSRGGQRVYTHMVLLDQAGFRRFDCDPVRVHSALAEIVTRHGPILDASRRLEPLTLNAGQADSDSDLWPSPERELTTDIEWVWAIAASLLERQSTILLGARQPARLLEWALLSVPLGIRRHVDASVGLKFSSGRRMQLVLVDDDEAAIRRLIRGQDIQLFKADASPPPPRPGLAPWFNLLRRWWQEERFDELVDLTTHAAADATPDDLPRIAAEYEEADRTETPDGEDDELEDTPQS